MSSESGLLLDLLERAYKTITCQIGVLRYLSSITHLGEDFAKPCEDNLVVKLVLIERQAFDEFFHGSLRFKRQKRQAKGNILPLSRFLCQTEPLAKLLDNALGLFLLQRSGRQLLFLISYTPSIKRSHLFDKVEYILHCALERFLVDSVFPHRQVTDD